MPLVSEVNDGECVECGRQYKNKRGLAIHERSAHAEIYHARCAIIIEETHRSQRKSRWDSEESAVMARAESKLVRQGLYAINQALVKVTAGRTLEAIKSHRKLPAYRQMVRSYLRTTGGLIVDEAVVPARIVAEVTGGATSGPQDDNSRQGDDRSSPVATRVAEVRSPGPQPATLAGAAGPAGPTGRSNDRNMTDNQITTMADVHQLHTGRIPSGAICPPDGKHKRKVTPRPEARVETRPLSPIISRWSDEETDSDPLPDTQNINTPVREEIERASHGIAEGMAGEYDWRAPVKTELLNLATDANICPELLHEVLLSPCGDRELLQELIDVDLLGFFPPAERPRRNVRRRPEQQAPVTSRAKRRAAYSRVQALYKKSRTSCARTILAGKWREVAPSVELREQVAYWKTLFEHESQEDSREPPAEGAPEWEIVNPVTKDEVARHMRGLKDGAAGPDGKLRKHLKGLNTGALAARFNLWLLAGMAPDAFREGVTVLIPKSNDSTLPQDHRPITLGPILCRLYHRILAERVERHYRISERQKAFRRGDGLAENCYILRTVIDDRKARCQATNIAFIDVSKAFDSVSHESIFLAAASAGIPDPLVDYVRSVYGGLRTRIRANGELSEVIAVNRGVRQGDPLSPVLFNAVIDLALRHMDPEIGVKVDSERLSCLAFADDLVLLASTPQGLQKQFSGVERALCRSGLALNVGKSATLRLDVHGKRKRWACNPVGFLKCRNGGTMRAMSITDGYMYLGNTVSAGVASEKSVLILKAGIKELTQAPLKPQQRMYILRNNLIPSLMHSAVLGSISKKSLKFLDTMTRAAVRSWLRLPRDAPFGYFHADFRDGGLSVTPLLWTVPLLRTKRMTKLVASPDPVARAVSRLPIFARERNRWSRPLSAYGLPIRDAVGIKRAMAEGLHTSVDGRGLNGSFASGHVNAWMTSGTARMTGSGYVNCIRIKGNLPYTRARAARGRPEKPIRCDACNEVESLGHILQRCSRTHQPRNDRHDKINKFLNQSLKKLGFQTQVEPPIPTTQGVRYPDLVAWREGRCVVIDTTVVADNRNPDEAHARKATYYDTAGVRKWCADKSGVPAKDISMSACALTWRGIPSQRSVRELATWGITKSHWQVMSIQALEGSVKCYAHFFHSTSGTRAVL